MEASGHIYCEHLREYEEWDRAAFSFDIDIRTEGRRYVLCLCKGCYNRLVGQIVNDTIRCVIAKEMNMAIARKVRR